MTPEKWGPDEGEMPEREPSFPWDSIPEDEERYVAVDPVTLRAIKGLADLVDFHPHALPAIRAILRVATIDPHGRIVIGIRIVRDLDQ